MSLSLIFALLPDAAGLFFVVGWPSLYRNLGAKTLLVGAADRLSLTQAGKGIEGQALANYAIDLTLVTTSSLLLLLNITRLVASFADSQGRLPDWSLGLWIPFAVLIVWVYLLHKSSDVKEYLSVLGDPDGNDPDAGVSPFFGKAFGPGRKFRVAGPIARRIFWTRLLVAMITFVIGVFAVSFHKIFKTF